MEKNRLIRYVSEQRTFGEDNLCLISFCALSEDQRIAIDEEAGHNRRKEVGGAGKMSQSDRKLDTHINVMLKFRCPVLQLKGTFLT
ncbi:hypothetical protein Desti_2790 [Desulfomonile tiedjei DSM 6799]|uniref:Uncharacterized protein n=1 Tax=Desulfomonile tiedjei (strain ATCC 49306 / DSM 6799 / DCB-1) TaxID=706587 RepID=I4C7C0_DESTA|nr:hypothetical protein Desti_2790 [Desulfomonile tiedjei DSM 6799]